MWPMPVDEYIRKNGTCFNDFDCDEKYPTDINGFQAYGTEYTNEIDQQIEELSEKLT